MFWFSWDSKFKVTKWQLWKKLVEESRGAVILFSFVLVCYILLALHCGSSQLSCQVCLSPRQRLKHAALSFLCTDGDYSASNVLPVTQQFCLKVVKVLTLSFVSLITSVWGWPKNWLCPSCLWWFLSVAGQSSDFGIRGIPPPRNICSNILDSLTRKKSRNCTL